LVELRAKLNRPARTEDDHWTAEQRAVLSEDLPAVAKAVSGPLAKLVRGAGRDLDVQAGRANAIAELSAEHEGKPAGKFEIKGTAGDVLSDADLNGKVTVLHFWDYRHEPLEEPYGQVGYLEFLYSRHKTDGIKVYGIAVDSRLNEEQTRGAVFSGVRKLKAFMNLSYPILFDGGEVLKLFGDPRQVGATLPLFVVVGPDGKILHYHVGSYEVDKQEGLKQLDAVVSGALKTKS
jgi:peroxiredoxin